MFYNVIYFCLQLSSLSMDSLVLDYSINPDDAARIMAELEERYRYFISILLSPRHRPSILPKHPCEHSRINILQWILTKHGTYLVLKRIRNPIDFQGHRSKVKVTGLIFTLSHPCEHSRINILQWILTKLGTYLVLKRI